MYSTIHACIVGTKPVCMYMCIVTFHVLLCISVYRVLDELKYKQYHSQMDRYLQLFHHRPVASALYKKVYSVIHTCTSTYIHCIYMLFLHVLVQGFSRLAVFHSFNKAFMIKLPTPRLHCSLLRGTSA